MKVGEYARLNNTLYDTVVILKIMKVYDNTILTENDGSIFQGEYGKDEIVNHSYNIIDLIEVGDYVNGLPVERIEGTLDDENDIKVWFGVATYGRTTLNQINHRYTVKDELEDDYSLRFRCIKPEDIKSIVTKEQFSSMEYKVK